MIRKHWKGIVFFSMISVFLMAEIHAQGQPNRLLVREKLNTLRLVRMTQALDLSEEQTSKIFPLANRLEREKIDINDQIGKELQSLRDLIKRGMPKEEDLLSGYATIQNLRKKIREKDDEFEKFMEGQLSPVQKVKYLVFTVDFFRGVGEQLNRARNVQNRVVNPSKKKS